MDINSLGLQGLPIKREPSPDTGALLQQCSTKKPKNDLLLPGQTDPAVVDQSSFSLVTLPTRVRNEVINKLLNIFFGDGRLAQEGWVDHPHLDKVTPLVKQFVHLLPNELLCVDVDCKSLVDRFLTWMTEPTRWNELNTSNVDGENNFFHHVASYGSPDAVQCILNWVGEDSNRLNFLKTLNCHFETFFSIAVSNFDHKCLKIMLNWAKDDKDRLSVLKSPTGDRQISSLMPYESLVVVMDHLKSHRQFLDVLMEESSHGMNFFHEVAGSDCLIKIQYLLTFVVTNPQFWNVLNGNSKYGKNFFHYVVDSDNKDSILHVLDFENDHISGWVALMNSKEESKSPFFSYVFTSSSLNTFQHVLDWLDHHQPRWCALNISNSCFLELLDSDVQEREARVALLLNWVGEHEVKIKMLVDCSFFHSVASNVAVSFMPVMEWIGNCLDKFTLLTQKDRHGCSPLDYIFRNKEERQCADHDVDAQKTLSYILDHPLHKKFIFSRQGKVLMNSVHKYGTEKCFHMLLDYIEQYPDLTNKWFMASNKQNYTFFHLLAEKKEIRPELLSFIQSRANSNQSLSFMDSFDRHSESPGMYLINDKVKRGPEYIKHASFLSRIFNNQCFQKGGKADGDCPITSQSLDGQAVVFFQTSPQPSSTRQIYSVSGAIELLCSCKEELVTKQPIFNVLFNP